MIYPILYAASDYANLITVHIGLSLIFIGILLGVSLVVTATIISSRDNKGLLFYAFAIVAMLLIVAYINGLLYPLMPDSPELHRALYPYISQAANIFLLLFVRELFTLKRRRPFVDRFLVLYLFASLAFPLIHIIVGFSMLPLVANMVSLVTILILFLMGVEAYIARLPSAFFYLVALVFYLLPTAYSILGARGLLPYDVWGRHSYELGLLFLGVFISLSIRETLRETIKLRGESSKRTLVVDTRDKMKSEFLAAMSHEIRTPINGVLGMAQLLQKTNQNQTQQYYTDTIINSGQTLLTVINDILDLSKSDAGKMSLEPEPVNLGQLIVNISNKFSSNINSKKMRYHYSLDPLVPNFVITDPVRLEQVISNLLTNAAKFTEDGSIVLSISKLAVEEDSSNQATLRFTVTDTGVGISAQMQDSIFDPYTQDRDSALKTSPFNSTGLGLTICKRLVELMQGSIFVDSHPGKGAKFWFEIPVKIDNPKQALYQTRQKQLSGFHIGLLGMPALHEEALSAHLRSVGIIVSGFDAIDQASKVSPPIDVLVSFVLNPCQLHDDITSAALAGNYKVLALLKPGLEEPSSDDLHSLLVSYLRVPAGVNFFFQALFYLLLTEHEKTLPTSSLETSAPNATDHKQTNVLVVEDNAVNQKVAEAMLESLGCTVLLANNGLEGFEMYKKHCQQLDFVLMDCEMPVMDGFDCTRNIRQHETDTQLENIRIVALTAHALPVNKELCLKSGMNSVLTKPIKFNHLEQTLAELKLH
jgi:signal transduction histidine kinase/ActR/RegA family two-component response regulator